MLKEIKIKVSIQKADTDYRCFVNDKKSTFEYCMFL